MRTRRDRLFLPSFCDIFDDVFRTDCTHEPDPFSYG